MGLRLGFWALFTCFALASTGSAASAQIGDLRRPLDRAERRTLASGQIVTRPATERRGALDLFGGLSYIVVDLPVEAVWRALNDDSRYYRRMLPQVERAVEEERHGERSRVIRFHHSVGPVDASYSVRFQFDPANKTVIFRLDDSRPHDIRSAFGFFRIREQSPGTTRIAFGAMIDVGDGLIGGSLRPTLHEWVLKIPWTFKRYVEGSGRRRYARD